MGHHVSLQLRHEIHHIISEGAAELERNALG